MNSIFLIEYSHEGEFLSLGTVVHRTREEAHPTIAKRDTDAFDLRMRVVEYAPVEDFNRLADRATAMVGSLELQVMELERQLGAANRALDTIRKGPLANSIN
jgi:hypothetical protein